MRRPRHLLLMLLLFAGILELFYLLLVALSPFPGLHLASTPLPGTWPWTLFPSQLLLSLINPLIGKLSHYEWYSSLLLGIALTVLMGTYAGAIFNSIHLRQDGKIRQQWLFLLLGGALLFGLTLLLQPLLFSDDIFTYILSGRIIAVYGFDPLNTAPNQFPHDPFLPWVISGHNTPNIYGSLWLFLASLLVRISSEPAITLLLFKSVALLAHLINILLTWAILGKIAPARQLLGTLLYAWNPLVLIELAGSGHSEGILLMLLLLAVWCYIQDQDQGKGSRYALCAFLVFGIAISTNLIALLLGPLFIWFDVRTEKRPYAVLWGLCWRAFSMLIPALVISLPFWHGEYTFFAITSAIDMDHFVHSPVSTLAGPIRHLFQSVATLGHFRPILQPITAADVTLRASVTFIFLLIYLNLFSRVHRAASTTLDMDYNPDRDQTMKMPGFDVLLSSWSVAIFWYLILVSGWFWPWYILWMLWIVVLRRFDAFNTAILVLSGTALFIYPFVGFTRAPISTYQSALIFGIPLVYLITVMIAQRYTERIAALNDR